MKHILLLFTASLVLCAGCTSGQSSAGAAPEPGLYISTIKTEECSVSDTIELRLLRTKDLYRVSRRIGMWITKQDSNRCIRYNSTRWPAVYDEKKFKLQGTDERPVIHFDPASNDLYIGGETYLKSNSHVPD